jgi:hypothetical protein
VPFGNAGPAARVPEPLVDYLLQRRGITVDALLAAPIDRRATEAELLVDSSL